eukprot:1016706-Rhodomonas_salina.1
MLGARCQQPDSGDSILDSASRTRYWVLDTRTRYWAPDAGAWARGLFRSRVEFFVTRNITDGLDNKVRSTTMGRRY